MRILILGGYGFFGELLLRRLGRNPKLVLIVAGRDIKKAEALAAELNFLPASMGFSCVDATNEDSLKKSLASLLPDIVVNICGPFQSSDYRVAESCIAAGCHYMDLADGRDFVTNINKLNAAAVAKNVLIISGASSVPAISCAVLDKLSGQFQQVLNVDIGISPGNKTERGLATVAGILSYCGAPMRVRREGAPALIYGWFGGIRHVFPDPIGARWLSDCDVPDLELMPVRYPSLRSVRFRAGLELPILQFGMMVMSLLRRLGLVSNWSRYAAHLKYASEWLRSFGSDNGAMYVGVKGIQAGGNIDYACWTLVAGSGDGPYVPVLASAALINKLLRGQLTARGAMPCVGLLSLEEILFEADGLDITTTIGRG